MKGTTVVAKDVDPKQYGDISGIYFFLSREEAERIRDRETEEEISE